MLGGKPESACDVGIVEEFVVAHSLNDISQ
jgi:hypothetical protein